MEDYKFILYIVMAVAYFLFTNWRKFMKGIDEEPKKFRDPDAAPDVPRTESRTLRPETPATSFEDILRELQPKLERAQKKAAPVLVPVEAQVVETKVGKYRNYDTEYAAKAYTDERLAEAREISRRTQEARRNQAFEHYVKPVQQKRSSVSLEMLRNPATARQAFVLSEIFQRKF